MREQMESIETNRQAVRGRLGELLTRLSQSKWASRHSGQTETFTRRISVGFDEMGSSDRRQRLRLVVDELVYDDGELIPIRPDGVI